MGPPRLLVIEIDRADPVGRLGQWLADAGLELDVRRLAGSDTDQVIPQTLDDVAGLLVLGGGPDSGPDGGGASAVRPLLREAISSERPTLAIGRGAEELAAAHGGRAGPDSGEPEYGPELIAKRAAAATDPLFGPMPITPDVIQWHAGAISTLPPAAVQLASAPACDLQAFRLGRLAWGLQFHIETEPEWIHAWAEADAGVLDGYDIEAMLSRSDAVHADIAEVWRPFAASFAEIVEDPAAVSPAHPPRSSTAAPVTDPAAIRAALAAEAHAARTPLPNPGVRRTDEP